MKDAIVDEVRKHRMEHTRKFGGNLAAICADLRSIQKESGYVVVRLKSIKPESTRASRPQAKAHS